MPRRRRVTRAEAGMVTAETAVVLPVLVLVLAGAVAAVVVVGAQLRCVDAAREAARAAARGEDSSTVTTLARAAGPDGAVVRISESAGEVRVEVRAEVAPLGALPLTATVEATAVARVEPGRPRAAGRARGSGGRRPCG